MDAAHPDALVPAPAGRRAAWLLYATAALAGAALVAPGLPMLVQEPGLVVFTATLAAMHASPFVCVGLFARRATGRRAIVAAALALLAEAALLMWAYSVLDDDAQAGLVYVFVTPVASMAIAGLAALACVPGRRR